MDGGDGSADLVINKRFVSEAELEERRKRRQEEWEKVRKPEDPEGMGQILVTIGKRSGDISKKTKPKSSSLYSASSKRFSLEESTNCW